MAKYNDKQAGSPSDAKIFLIANATTGKLEKITMAQAAAYIRGWINANGGLAGGGGGSPVQLSTPGNFTAVAAGSDTINLDWDAVANATSYLVERSLNGTSGWSTAYAGTSTAFADTGRAASTQYYYRVSAIGDGVNYTNSGYATANATTGAASPSLTYLTWNTLGDSDGSEQYNTNKGIRKKASAGSIGWQAAAAISVSNQQLSSGQRLKFKINDTAKAVNISLSSSQTPLDNSAAPGLPFGMYAGFGLTAFLGKAESGNAFNLSHPYSAGDWGALFYDGATIKYQHSTDGVTFTTIDTSTNTPSGSYYVQVQFYNGQPFGLDEIGIE